MDAREGVGGDFEGKCAAMRCLIGLKGNEALIGREGTGWDGFHGLKGLRIAITWLNSKLS
jgi:hypothetical protein